ncbi:ATP-binding protein [Candidatus Woesearchaeota archaeon]|nr:ATP-binding protein [Candidatus Woesearchaeota archaeon]
MAEFKDRKREMKELKETLDKKGFAFEIIYGRRRIGKTELILQATKKKKRVYYLAIGENNLERFYNVCVGYDKNIKILKKDYDVLFDYLKDNAEVVIIDEFQNIIKENPEFLKLFQAIIDTNLKSSNLKLFILGSSVSIITSKILSYQSPVYGRKTASMKLKNISFLDLKEFFPKTDMEELIRIYGFADGIPFYLIKINKGFWEWITDELKREKGFLRDEVDFLMKLEFEDSSTYKLILNAIANGKNTINEIKDFIKVRRTDITPYIRNLIEVDFIKREVPLIENQKSRFGRYYLKDNFMKFWFRYIYPNLSSLEQGIFKIENIKKDYSAYLGPVFEEVIKQILPNLEFFDFSKIGRWWHKDKEIDIVALNEESKEVLFGECKWKDKVDAEKIVFELRNKVQYFNWNNEKRKEYFAVFAKSFKNKIKEFDGKKVFCFDLKDIEKISMR